MNSVCACILPPIVTPEFHHHSNGARRRNVSVSNRSARLWRSFLSPLPRQIPKPAALFQLFQNTVINKVCRFGLARFSSRNFLENFLDPFYTHVRNRIAAVTHTVGLVQLGKRLGVGDLGVLG